MTMPRQWRTMLAAATLSAAAAVCSAQAANQSGPGSAMQAEAAPIEHAYANQYQYQIAPATIAPGEDVASGGGEAQANPIPGVVLRVGAQSSVEEVSREAQKLELRVDRGVANINVHKPAKDTVILVDLPGGQTQLLKDGLYTFNAQTNTARVLKGEALAFPAGIAEAKPLKVKEYNKFVFGSDSRPHEFVPYEAAADVLPGPAVPGQRGGGVAPAYGFGPYGDGFYAGYPYYAYGAWGNPFYYPYGYGFYPAVGFGFGYYGGFHGGYHGGVHGGGFHGARR